MPEFQVGVIIMRDRATVLLARHTDTWSLPRIAVAEGESVRDASARLAKAVTGLEEVDPKQSLFFCEQLKPTHDVALFCLVVATGETELKPNEWNCRWADVRELGKIQADEGMDDFSAQAFLKFADYLRAQASAATSGRVN